VGGAAAALLGCATTIETEVVKDGTGLDHPVTEEDGRPVGVEAEEDETGPDIPTESLIIASMEGRRPSWRRIIRSVFV